MKTCRSHLRKNAKILVGATLSAESTTLTHFEDQRGYARPLLKKIGLHEANAVRTQFQPKRMLFPQGLVLNCYHPGSMHTTDLQLEAFFIDQCVHS